MPNEIKLDGVGSYPRGMLILRTKSMGGYVLAKVLEPEDREGRQGRTGVEDVERYKFTSSHLASEFFVTCCVEALSTSTKVWDAYQNVFGQGKCLAGSQIEDTIYDLTQGEKSMMTYVGE
jgi:hypothetical protein